MTAIRDKDRVVGRFARLRSPRWMIFITSGGSALIFFGMGSLASQAYSGTGNKISHPSECFFLMIWVVIISPFVWWTYWWQARLAPSLYIKLRDNRIFVDEPRAEKEAQRLIAHLTNPAIYGVAGLMVMALWITNLINNWPKEFKAGEPPYWYDVKWYLPFHLAVFSLGLFGISVFLLRHSVFIWGLAQFFARTEVKVHPLYHDGVGGFGPIKRIVVQSMAYVIGFGVMLALFSLQFLLNDINPMTRTDVWTFLVLYVVLAPYSLALPVHSVGGAMLKYRNKVLSNVAAEFQAAILVANQGLQESNTTLKETNDRLEELKRYRDMIYETYPTSPFTLRALRNLSITAALPVFASLISFVLELRK